MNILSFAIFYFSIRRSQGRIDESLRSLASDRVEQKCPSGYRADPENCHLFYHCEGYRTAISCGILMFNDLTKTCDWPTRVMQLRPECSLNYKLRRKAKTEDQMGRLDEGEIMRHFGGDIAINVIRQERKDGSGQRFDFRGKAVSQSEPVIRIRKNKYKKLRKMVPRRVRMLRRRLVKKNPTQGKRKSHNRGLRIQKNIVHNPQNNEHRILKDKPTEDKDREQIPNTRVHTSEDAMQHIQQSQNRINIFDESIKEITFKKASFSTHTPMTVLMNKVTEAPPKTIRVRISPTQLPKIAKQIDTRTEDSLQEQKNETQKQHHNSIVRPIDSTTIRNDITEIFMEEPRVGALQDQPRIRLPGPNDSTKPKIPISMSSLESPKHRIFKPNFSVLSPRFRSKERPITLNDAKERPVTLNDTKERSIPLNDAKERPITLNDAFQQRSGARQRIHSNVEVSSPTFGLKINNPNYLESNNIRKKDESNIRKQDEISTKEGRDIEVDKPEKELNVEYNDSNNIREKSIKIREEISNEIRRMLEKAEVNPGTQDNISSCITYYLTCKTSKQKGQCLQEFNACSGAQILLPDLYEDHNNVVN